MTNEFQEELRGRADADEAEAQRLRQETERLLAEAARLEQRAAGYREAAT